MVDEEADEVVSEEDFDEDDESGEDGVEEISAERAAIHASILKLGKDLKKYSLTMPDREARAIARRREREGAE